MARPAFDSPLILKKHYDPDTGDERWSPVATGPIDPGDVIKWIAVWIFQSREKGPAAAATGRSGYDEDIQDQWEVETFLVSGSDDFDTDKPALAMALALIWRGGDEKRREFYWWVDPVMLEKESE
jgi:hypothetical protein